MSILALLISVFSLIWTLSNQWEQNRRWEKLNNANIELKEARMINWKDITEKEAHTTVWGYIPLIYPKGEATNIYTLPYCLIARDSANKKNDRINPVFTLSEVNRELKIIEYNGGNIIVNKMFRPKFIFENMGKTEAKSLSIKIDAKLANKEWQNAFTSNTLINLAGGQSSTAFFDFELPINFELPPQITFKVFLKFQDVNNKKVEKIISIKWTNNDNFWSYESVSE